MSIYLIIAIIFLILFMLTGFFIFWFYFQLQNVKKKYLNLKINTENLFLVNFNQKVEALNSLSEFHDEYEIVIDQTFIFKEKFQHNISIIMGDLSKVNFLIKNFNIFKAKKYLNQLEEKYNDEVKKLNKLDKDINAIYSFNNYVDSVFIKYLTWFNFCIDFFEKNLMNKYDNEIILIKIKNLNNALNSCFDFKNKKEIENMYDYLVFLLEQLYDFTVELNDLYISDKANIYFKKVIKEINNLLISNNLFLHKDTVKIEKKINSINNNINFINENNLAFKSNNNANAIKDCFCELDDISKKLNYNLKSSIINISWSEKINEWYNFWGHERNSIEKIINNIGSDFKNDTKVNNMINEIKQSIHEISNYFDWYNKTEINHKIEKYIFIITNLATSFYNWKFFCKNLINYVNDRNISFKTIIKEIGTYKLTIANLLDKNAKYNVYNQNDLKNISSLLNNLNLCESQLIEKKNSYNDSSKITKQLLEVKDQIYDLSFPIQEKVILESYARDLIIYFNNWVTIEENIKDIDYIKIIDESNNLFENKQYLESINTILSLILSRKKGKKYA